jgi:hypothetical protein
MQSPWSDFEGRTHLHLSHETHLFANMILECIFFKSAADHSTHEFSLEVFSVITEPDVVCVRLRGTPGAEKTLYSTCL